MKKIIIVLSAIIIAGLIGAGVWAFQQSNSTAKDPEPETSSNSEMKKSETETQKQETSPAPKENAPTAPERRTATFESRNNEQISGSVSLIDRTIRLEDDFHTANGPDLYLYIGNANNHTTQIAKLKAANGAQNYELPKTIDPKSITHIWIYCRAFDVNFGVADIR